VRHAEVTSNVLEKAGQSDKEVACRFTWIAPRSLIAALDFHGRGLSATVRPDQPIAVPAAKLDGHVRKQGLGPNCMAMLEATITGIAETKKLAEASLG
jgi:hypothetical protein